jgi:uncharacterized protein YbaP (TraB family)
MTGIVTTHQEEINRMTGFIKGHEERNEELAEKSKNLEEGINRLEGTVRLHKEMSKDLEMQYQTSLQTDNTAFQAQIEILLPSTSRGRVSKRLLQETIQTHRREKGQNVR